MAFTGRSRQLRILESWLDRVATASGGSAGQALVIS